MEANTLLWHLPTKCGYKEAYDWKLINPNSLAGRLLHLTFDLLMGPLTSEYHGGQYRASTNQVWLQAGIWLKTSQPESCI